MLRLLISALLLSLGLPLSLPRFHSITLTSKLPSTVAILSAILSTPAVLQPSPSSNSPSSTSSSPITCHAFHLKSSVVYLNTLPPSYFSPSYSDPIFASPTAIQPFLSPLPSFNFDADIAATSLGCSDPYISAIGIAVPDPRKVHSEIAANIASTSVDAILSPITTSTGTTPTTSFTVSYYTSESPVNLRFYSPPAPAPVSPLPLPPSTPIGFDHIVSNVPLMEPYLAAVASWWPASTVGPLSTFASFTAASVGTAKSGLNSIALHPLSTTLLLPINEPVNGTPVRSQINTFLQHNGGHTGIQHVALQCEDVVSTVMHLRKSGVLFIERPNDQYYSDAFDSVHNKLTEEQQRQIVEAGLLIDYETTPGSDDVGMLLQVFTRPLNDERPGLFFELIQRVGCGEGVVGCGGFGVGNFKRLFEAIEAMEREAIKIP